MTGSACLKPEIGTIGYSITESMEGACDFWIITVGRKVRSYD